MGRPKREIDPDLTKEMQDRGREWLRFRLENLFSQMYLAETIGISRRTLQYIETAKLIPQAATIAKFEILRGKYEAEGKGGGRKKSKAA